MKCFFFLFALSCSLAIAADPAKSLPRSSPEAQGVASKSVLDFIQSADKNIDSLHSFMLVRHGKVVTEGWWGPYNAATKHELYSLSKSFTSTAVGLAIADGKLKLEDPVIKFFPDDVPADASPQLKAMRVRDLLTMSTGHESEPKVGPKEAWTKTFLSHPVTKEPGTHFLYNTPSTYMQSAIVQKQTGMTTYDFLKPRLFEPLGIEGATWGMSPQGVSLGGYGLSVRTEDIAKFGQLLLQKGEWNGQQLIPAEWVEAATSNQVSTRRDTNGDWGQGYGYQFWQCQGGNYRGDGAFGQYCIVLPQHDAVIAITSGVKDMQSVLTLVWEKIVPAFHAEALAPDMDAERRLKDRLGNLSLPTPTGTDGTDKWSKIEKKRFGFEKNPQELESLSMERTGSGAMTLVLKYNGEEQRLPCGFKEWKSAKLKLGSMPEQPVFVSGAWKSDSEFHAKLCLVETPFVISMKFAFQGDELVYDSESNVGFAQTKQHLIGRISTAK